jgi:hypothetical protein
MIPSRETGVPFLRHEYHGPHDHKSQQQGLVVHRESAVEVSQQFLGSRIGRRRLDSQQVIDLADEDNEGNARGKAADHSRGDEGNEASQAQEPDDKQEQAREQPCNPDPRHPVACHQHYQHRGHRARRPADLERRTGESAHDESGKDGGDQSRGSRGT